MHNRNLPMISKPIPTAKDDTPIDDCQTQYFVRRLQTCNGIIPVLHYPPRYRYRNIFIVYHNSDKTMINSSHHILSKGES